MSSRTDSGVPGATLVAPVEPEWRAIVSTDALEFLAALHRKFDPARRELLARRVERQQAVDAGQLPDFLPESAEIRESAWTVAPIPSDLQDRRVEITGPVERKMVINALNSGAHVFMADFEDSNAPTLHNNLAGQVNLRDAVRGDIEYVSPEGKFYQLGPQPAVLLVRPRGLHLVEKHMLIDGEPISGSLFDFGLFFFHNAHALLRSGTAPYFYLPKLQSHREARFWNEVFGFAQDYLDIARGTIRATVLIETVLAAFEMHEILYELREHSAGLNCGRWDYLFSFIKVYRNHPQFTLPDRGQVTMDRAFLRAYVELLIQTCHRRNIHAMGGMAAQIPIKDDPEANRAALEKVRQDKLREVKAGHDGTWVAHPGLVAIAREVFDAHMPAPNQIPVKRDEVRIDAAALREVTPGEITAAGLRTNIDVGLRYLESWLRGSGCVPIHHLMEDAATAEICRTQVWQWIKHGASLADGRRVTAELVRGELAQQLAQLTAAAPSGRFREAGELFEGMMTRPELTEFLTLEAYRHLR